MPFIYLSILFTLLTASAENASADTGKHMEAICRSSADIGHGDTAADWQRGNIGARLREATQIKAPPMGMGYARQQLREMFENKDFSCKLTVKPDGSIAHLQILTTSGFAAIDQRALDLITRAAPFRKSTLTEDQHYVIEFPLLTVKPAKQ